MKITKDLVKFDIETAVIVALDAKYKDIQITDGKSYAFVMDGLREYRELRLAVVEGHKKEKAEALEHCNFLDAEKRRILERLAPGENYLKEIRQAEDDRKAAIKAEEERKERQRIEAIQVQIASISSLGLLHNMPSSKIKEYLNRLQEMKISEDTYMEFTDRAIQVQWETITELKALLADRLQFEKEEAERKAEAERLEKVHKEQEEAQKIIEEANRKIELRHQEFEEKQRKAELHEAQKEFERQAIIKAEQEVKEKAGRELRERMEREAAEDKEKARQAAMAPDKEKLIKFADGLVDIAIPDVKSDRAKRMALEISNRLNELATEIKKQASKL